MFIHVVQVRQSQMKAGDFTGLRVRGWCNVFVGAHAVA